MSINQKLHFALLMSFIAVNIGGCGDDDDDGGAIPCPADMVGFTAPDGPTCIDLYETTNAKVADFLNEQGNECSGHPCVHIDEPGCKIEVNGPDFTVMSGYEEHPVVQITWHGSKAYCEHHGRLLCVDEAWVGACTGANENTYPYGTTYDPTACNSADTGNGATVSVGSMSGCTGGVDGLYDMSGNVYEWTAACGSGPCLIRGGSFDKSTDQLTCDASHEMDGPNGHREDLGLRCCTPPLH